MAVLTGKPSLAIADTVSWYVELALAAVILLSSVRESSMAAEEQEVAGRRMMGGRPCDEIYVVEEGETLHTISDKCGDPFIVERNPHIHDPDDVFPGLVIMLNPSPSSKHTQPNRGFDEHILRPFH